MQTPVAYLNCNFSAPVGGKPALFTHDEVITLFHEFGHGLHHLLTRVEDLGVSGINGVEWDAVELPSQFMENFCWEWDVLQPHDRATSIPAQPLPRALFDKMLAAKNFQSGMQTVRQIEFSLFDMHLHYDFDPAGGKTALRTAGRGAPRASRWCSRPPTTASPTISRTFSPAATRRVTTATSGRKCCRPTPTACSRRAKERRAQPGSRPALLERNPGSGRRRPALESFIAFRGREPTIDALLRHNGMA